MSKSKNRDKTNQAAETQKAGTSAIWIPVIVAIVGVLGILAPKIFDYIVDKNSLQATQTAIAVTLTHSVSPSLAPTLTPDSTALPVSATTTYTPTPAAGLKYTLPTMEDLNIYPIIPISYQTTYSPSVLTDKATVASYSPYLWTYAWCTKHTSLLSGNLESISFSFLVNDVEIDKSNILIFKEKSKDNWDCQRWTTLLSEWGSSPSYKLSVVLSNARPIFDGVETLRPGLYRYDITVRVK
jgi:hypothetical protein